MPDDLRVEPLDPSHDREAFDCGEPALDTYLRRQALQDVRRRMARAFVAVRHAAPQRVVGYYALSAASFDRSNLPPAAAKRLPHYPVPAAILGRLAVSVHEQGRGTGEFLLMDALRRVLQASTSLAVNAVIVDAKNDRAARFYARHGFAPFPSMPMRLFLPLATIEDAFGSTPGKAPRTR